MIEIMDCVVYCSLAPHVPAQSTKNRLWPRLKRDSICTKHGNLTLMNARHVRKHKNMQLMQTRWLGQRCNKKE
jgi:hypothetical protein